MSNTSNYSGDATSSKDAGQKQATKEGESNGNFADVKKSIAALGADVREDSADIAQKAKQAAQAKIDEANAGAKGYVEDVAKQVTDKPLQTVAIAFAAGAIFSMLLGRR